MAELGDPESPDKNSDTIVGNMFSLPAATTKSLSGGGGGGVGGFGASGFDSNRNELKHSGAGESTMPRISRNGNRMEGSHSSNKNKCAFVCVGGGSDLTLGVCVSSMSKVCCLKMRCTNCNFIVCRFQDYMWDDTVEYMFFRQVSVLCCFITSPILQKLD